MRYIFETKIIFYFRFAFKETLAYFNINKILPDTIEFLYNTDMLMFNATLAIPDAETLRMLTSKLGRFLGMNIIETISLNKVTSRFIIDLNLPSNIFFLNSLKKN